MNQSELPDEIKLFRNPLTLALMNISKVYKFPHFMSNPKGKEKRLRFPSLVSPNDRINRALLFFPPLFLETFFPSLSLSLLRWLCANVAAGGLRHRTRTFRGWKFSLLFFHRFSTHHYHRTLSHISTLSSFSR